MHTCKLTYSPRSLVQLGHYKIDLQTPYLLLLFNLKWNIWPSLFNFKTAPFIPSVYNFNPSVLKTGSNHHKNESGLSPMTCEYSMLLFSLPVRPFKKKKRMGWKVSNLTLIKSSALVAQDDRRLKLCGVNSISFHILGEYSILSNPAAHCWTLSKNTGREKITKSLC